MFPLVNSPKAVVTMLVKLTRGHRHKIVTSLEKKLSSLEFRSDRLKLWWLQWQSLMVINFMPSTFVSLYYVILGSRHTSDFDTKYYNKRHHDNFEPHVSLVDPGKLSENITCLALYSFQELSLASRNLMFQIYFYCIFGSKNVSCHVYRHFKVGKEW